MQALEIGHFRGVAGFNQGLETSLDEFHHAAAQHGLLAEQIGLAFFLEGGLDDAGAAAAIGGSVGERDVQRVAGGILRHGDQARHAAAALIFATHGMAWAFRRDHEHVDVGARLDQVEMDVQAMRERQRGAGAHVGSQMLAVQVALAFIGGQHHHHIGPFGGGGRVHDFNASALGLGNGGRARAQRHGQLFHAAVLQVQRMGVALAAIADNGDFFALDEVNVGILVIVNAHDTGIPVLLLKLARHLLRFP